MLTFDEFWTTGQWRKLGKDLAQRCWVKTVKTEHDYQEICRARELYAGWVLELKRVHAAKGTNYKPFVLHGGTWFGRWRDYLDDARGEVLVDEQPPADYDSDAMRSHAETILRDLQRAIDCGERTKPLPTLEAVVEWIKTR